MASSSSKLLHIEASPRGDASWSRRWGRAFVDRLTARDASVAVDRLDLWETDLPPFDGAMIDAKYAKLAGRDMTAPEARAWERIGEMVARLAASDRIVIATPMWNFGIPYRLKHWIDLITQPGLTFSFDPATGYSPLLKSRPTAVLLSSAGDYRRGDSFGRPDLATPYLKAALGFIGLTDLTFVPIAPTVGPANAEAEARAARDVDALAATF